MRSELIEIEIPSVGLFDQVLEYVYKPEELQIKRSESLPIAHLHKCIVIVKDDRPVARAAIYFNPELIYHNYKSASIGSVECIEDIEVMQFLIDQCSSIALENGFKYLIGPMNGSTWENYRFNYEHNAPLFLTEQLQQSYYNQFMLSGGFSEISSYFSSYTYDVGFKIPEFDRLDNHFKSAGVKLISITQQHYLEELEALYFFLSESFKSNFLYTPISKETFIQKYSSYISMIDGDYVIKAVDKNGSIIGIYFCFIDLYDKMEKTLVIKSIARSDNPKWRGLGQWMGQHIYNNAEKNGVQKIIHAFMKEDGTSNGTSKVMNGTPFKYYRLYGKHIGG